MRLKDSLYPCFQHWAANGSIWLISDTHFEDEDCKFMDKNWIEPNHQIMRINEKVKSNDTLIHLGDVGNPKYVEYWVKEIKARKKILILGNHDKSKSFYKDFFTEVYEAPLIIGPKIFLSHEPVLDLPFMFTICGHDHFQWRDLNMKNHINVAANLVDYYPISLKDLILNGALKNLSTIHEYTRKQEELLMDFQSS